MAVVHSAGMTLWVGFGYAYQVIARNSHYNHMGVKNLEVTKTLSAKNLNANTPPPPPYDCIELLGF